MSESLAKILDTYRNGDYLSDSELQALNSAMVQMMELASRLGPVFHLAGSYAAQVQYSTKGMIDARERREKGMKTKL